MYYAMGQNNAKTGWKQSVIPTFCVVVENFKVLRNHVQKGINHIICI